MADKFLLVGLKANLPAVRDNKVLYWCSDTRELYKGSDLYTEAVRVVASMPATPAQGVLYILPTGEAKVYTGTETKTVALPYVTTGTLSASSTAEQVPTAKVVYDSIVEAIGEATNGGDVINNITSTKAGTVTVTKGDSSEDVKISGVIVNPTYDAAERKITLPYADGTESLVITLGKDIFIDSAADNKYNAVTGNIELYLNDGNGDDKEPTKISIPASSLVDVYTGKATATATTTVSDDNEISVDVKVSAEANNAVTAKADGLFVDSKAFAAAADVEDLQDAVDTLNADDTTEGSVAKAIKDANTAVTNRLDTLEGGDTTDGSVAKAVKDSVDPLKERLDTLEADENTAGSVKKTVADAVKDQEDRLDVLEGDDQTEGSVAKTVADAIAWGTF